MTVDRTSIRILWATYKVRLPLKIRIRHYDLLRFGGLFSTRCGPNVPPPDLDPIEASRPGISAARHMPVLTRPESGLGTPLCHSVSSSQGR